MRSFIVGLIVGIVLAGIVISYIANRAVSQIKIKRDTEIAILEKDITRLQDNIRISDSIQANLLIEKNRLQSEASNISKALTAKANELKQIKGSLKTLTNNELVTEANKEYGQADTTEISICLSRPTTEFLVESAKKVKNLNNQLELAFTLNRSYEAQLVVDSSLFVEYNKKEIDYLAIIDKRNKQLNVSNSAFNRLEKQNKRRSTIKTLIIIGLGAIIVHDVTK